MADAIKLDEEECFLSFEINGYPFQAEAWEAGDLLSRHVDSKHASDPKGDQSFLDSTAELLRNRWGVPTCGRRAAWLFYSSVTGRLDELKKTTGLTPKSATGSESIPEAGASPESEPASTTSNDATPSEICASLT